MRRRHDWVAILRDWLSSKPSGFVFKSRDVFLWAASAVPLSRDDRRRIGQREAWRIQLSSALSDLHRSGELIHPSYSSYAWMIP